MKKKWILSHYEFHPQNTRPWNSSLWQTASWFILKLIREYFWPKSNLHPVLWSHRSLKEPQKSQNKPVDVDCQKTPCTMFVIMCCGFSVSPKSKTVFSSFFDFGVHFRIPQVLGIGFDNINSQMIISLNIHIHIIYYLTINNKQSTNSNNDKN